MNTLNIVLSIVTILVVSWLFFLAIKQYIVNFLQHRHNGKQYEMLEAFMQGVCMLVLYVLMILVLIGQM